jgi:hypothetical protein
MPTTTPTILDQISAEKTKISGRLARLDADRATVATQLTDLETVERVLTRVSKTPPARRSTSTTATEARPPPPPEAAGGRQRQPRTSQRNANPAGRASASVFLPWPPAKPDWNYMRHVPAIARTMSAWRYSAISARDGSRSATANSMRHRPQRSGHTRQPDPGSSKRRRAVLNWFKQPFPGQEIYAFLSALPGSWESGHK